MAAEKRRERRWIVLGTDGRHVTLGLHSDPSEEEILSAENGLASQGLAGWLALVEGDYWARCDKPSLMMVRPLSAPIDVFKDAAVAFEIIRVRTLQSA